MLPRAAWTPPRDEEPRDVGRHRILLSFEHDLNATDTIFWSSYLLLSVIYKMIQMP